MCENNFFMTNSSMYFFSDNSFPSTCSSCENGTNYFCSASSLNCSSYSSSSLVDTFSTSFSATLSYQTDFNFSVSSSNFYSLSCSSSCCSSSCCSSSCCSSSCCSSSCCSSSCCSSSCCSSSCCSSSSSSAFSSPVFSSTKSEIFSCSKDLPTIATCTESPPSQSSTIVGIEEIFPDGYGPLSSATEFLGEVWVVEVDNKNCSKVVCRVAEVEPTPSNMNHLKRCRKTEKEDIVEVIVGFEQDKINENVKKILLELNVLNSIKKVKVPFLSPKNKAQFVEYNKFWPVFLRPTAWKPLILQNNEREEMINLIKYAVELEEKNGSACCIITLNGKIVAIGFDKGDLHPLQHAVMDAVNIFAEKLVYLSDSTTAKQSKNKSEIDKNFGVKVSFENEIALERNSQQKLFWETQKSDLPNSTYSAECCDETKPYVASGCSSENGASTSSFTSRCSSVNDYSPLATSSGLHNNFRFSIFCNESQCVSPSTENFRESNCVSAIENTGQYLCTECVAYLSREPCWMCGMALVHSRFKLVVFHENKQIKPSDDISTSCTKIKESVQTKKQRVLCETSENSKRKVANNTTSCCKESLALCGDYANSRNDVNSLNVYISSKSKCNDVNEDDLTLEIDHTASSCLSGAFALQFNKKLNHSFRVFKTI